ncbi:MAG: DUF2171 domain-containing protein [Chloroflexota bacterium]|nr:DUF2171 domain-containing protein [Chloroflexota bacterium]
MGSRQTQYAALGFLLALPIAAALKAAMDLGGLEVFALMASGLFAALLAPLASGRAGERAGRALRVALAVAAVLVWLLLLDRLGAPLWIQILLLLLAGTAADRWRGQVGERCVSGPIARGRRGPGVAHPGRIGVAGGIAMAASGARGVSAGMVTVGSDGGIVGTVREVRGGDFLVERTLARDVYVPYGAVRAVVEDLIELDVPADEVEGMQWEHP